MAGRWGRRQASTSRFVCVCRQVGWGSGRWLKWWGLEQVPSISPPTPLIGNLGKGEGGGVVSRRHVTVYPAHSPPSPTPSITITTATCQVVIDKKHPTAPGKWVRQVVWWGRGWWGGRRRRVVVMKWQVGVGWGRFQILSTDPVPSTPARKVW